MTCDACGRRLNYCFYINDEYWRKVVGEERFKNSQGRICAHCTLEALGGLDWYIVYNEPAAKMRKNHRSECYLVATPATCMNPDCVDGVISVGCTVDGPLLTKPCPECQPSRRDWESNKQRRLNG